MKEGWEAVIGLEVHAQLNTKSKIFCTCSTEFGQEPNENTCPVCLGLPGALPVLNREAVTNAGKAALALNLHINPESIFARKNYFYPDLPKGYQISQYDRPFSEHGVVEILSSERDEGGRPVEWKLKRFGITRAHIEEDAGKSVHDIGDPSKSYINLNRAGTPLLEIVSEPDFRGSWEAYDYVNFLRRTLQYIGVCDGNMEEGNLRCDANVSVRPAGTTALGTKAEVKNLNSFRFLQKALEFEIARQSTLVARGERVVQETRLFDAAAGETRSMRSKEEAHDYRYFPEPDLPPVDLDVRWVEELRATLPELPEARRARFIAAFGLTDYEAAHIALDAAAARYFEATLAAAPGQAKAAANWMMGELARKMKTAGHDFATTPLDTASLAGLIGLVARGRITLSVAKTVFDTMYDTGEDAATIVEREGLASIEDEGEIERLVAQVIRDHADAVTQYRAGKKASFGFLVGQVMRASGGKANPQHVNASLRRALE
jgi:aspartyl-tRNA(Asn)/glutamyl-tRNA(Gln) amidotransferase subunit B